MSRYAVLNKNTNSVTNTVIIDDKNVINFLLQDDELLVPASRSVQIGMIYDKKTKTFPEIYELDKFLDLKYELQDLIEKQEKVLKENGYLKEEQLTIQLDYLNKLQEGNKFESYDDLKNHLDSLENPPEVPPAPKIITQDLFRSVLTLSEKILWDNPQTGTSIQEATINTLKMEFPYYGVESMAEEFDLLFNIDFLTLDRVNEIKEKLYNI